MGNGESISIELENGNVPHRAGETLRGTVRVCCKSPISRGELALRMYGKEKVAIRRGHGENRVTSRAQCEFFSSHVVLRNFGREPVARASVWEAPFAIPLPQSLPATASNPAGTRDVGFRIQYKIRAQLPSSHKSEIYVTVTSASLPVDPAPSDMEPISVPIKSFFRKRGTVTVGAHVEDTLACPGGALNVHLACQNESSALIRRVEVRLIECLRWKTHRHDQREVKTLDVLSDVSNLPGLCRDRASAAVARSGGGTDVIRQQEAIAQALHESRCTGCNRVTLRVPSHARDSYYGQLVQVWHMVEVRLQTAQLTTTPSKSIAVRIGSPRGVPREVSVTALPIAAGTPLLLASTVVEPPEWQPRTVTPPPSEGGSQPPSPADDGRVDRVIPIACAVPLPGDVPEYEEERVIVLDEEAIVALTMPPVPPPRTLGHLSAPDVARHTAAAAKGAAAKGAPARGPITLPSLLHAMRTSVSAYDLAHHRLHNVPEWQRFLSGLSPSEYGQVVAAVRGNDPDQTRLAEELAQYVRPTFTCAHAAEAVQRATDWNRSNLAQRLIPLCSDLPENHDLIRRQLSRWERTAMNREFEDALKDANRRRARGAS